MPEVHDIFAQATNTAICGQALTPTSCRPPLTRDGRQIPAWGQHFLSCGISLRPEIELGAHDLLLDYAAIGLGVACVIEEFSLEMLDNGKLFKLELTQPVPQRSIGACWLSGIELMPAARRFIELVKNEA
jgi:DNA-binding transcriptional LysR family regulator